MPKRSWSWPEATLWVAPSSMISQKGIATVPNAPPEQLQPTTGDSEWVFESPRKPGVHIIAVRRATLRITLKAAVRRRAMIWYATAQLSGFFQSQSWPVADAMVVPNVPSPRSTQRDCGIRHIEIDL